MKKNTSFLPDFCATRLVFVVVLLAELLAIVLTLAQPPFVSNPLFELAMYSLFIQWVALSCVGVLCVARSSLQKLPDVHAAGVSYGLTLLVSFTISELAWWLLYARPLQEGYLRYGHGLFLLRCMGISAIVCALALRYFYVQHQWRRRIESEAEARYQALQSRIRPHFLFNCMNTIAGLTRHDPVLAEQAVEDLADLFRASLQDMRRTISLQEEIELCRIYLRIEKHRLGERLQVEWPTEKLPECDHLPPLTIQPLLENAIYHGIEPLADGGVVRISWQQTPEFVIVQVSNPLPVGAGSDRQQSGNKLAQENIRQRLAACFDHENLLQIKHHGNSYEVTVRLPHADENPDR